ncbi:hypothetical protein [Nostoc sp. DSM 114159]
MKVGVKISFAFLTRAIAVICQLCSSLISRYQLVAIAPSSPVPLTHFTISAITTFAVGALLAYGTLRER